jgi:hypothetical protein
MDDEERVSLDPLKPTQALKALLKIDPDASEAASDQCDERWKGRQCTLRAGHTGPCRYYTPSGD